MVGGFGTQEMKKNSLFASNIANPTGPNQSSLGLAAAMSQIRPRGNSHQSKLRSGGKINLLGQAPSNQRNIYNFQMSNNSNQGGKANSSSRRNKRATTTAGTSLMKDSYDKYQI